MRDMNTPLVFIQFQLSLQLLPSTPWCHTVLLFLSSAIRLWELDDCQLDLVTLSGNRSNLCKTRRVKIRKFSTIASVEICRVAPTEVVDLFTWIAVITKGANGETGSVKGTCLWWVVESAVVCQYISNMSV